MDRATKNKANLEKRTGGDYSEGFLRRATASRRTLEAYETAVNAFESWMEKKRFPHATTSEIDACMERYFEELARLGKEPFHGKNTLWGYVKLRLRNKTSAKVALASSKEALDGWCNVMKGEMRDPIPEELVFALAEIMIVELGDWDAAAATLLIYDSYARPSEILCMTKQHNVIVPKTGIASEKYGKQHALVIAPSQLGRTTKTGHFDDHVLVGINGRRWINQVLFDFMNMRPPCPTSDQLFAGLTLAKLESVFKEAQRYLGDGWKYADVVVTPHVLRHSGPSNDHYLGKTNLDEIRIRGRWASMKSVARYAKHAKLLRAVSKMPKDVDARSAKAQERLFSYFTAAKYAKARFLSVSHAEAQRRRDQNLPPQPGLPPRPFPGPNLLPGH